MEYIDLYLRFPSESEANSILFDVQIIGGKSYKKPKYTAIDTIGIIYKESGNIIQAEDSEFPEMLAIEGWHVNVRALESEDISALEPYRIEPTTPSRVWA